MSNFIQYAFIFPKNIGSIIKIKLIYKLEKINSINIAQNEMKLIICYYHYICSNLLQSKKNIKWNIDTYFKNIKNPDKYKKYFFVPIIKKTFNFELDLNKINDYLYLTEKKYEKEYFDKKDLEIFETIPSIFTGFEEKMKIKQFIFDFKLFNTAAPTINSRI